MTEPSLHFSTSFAIFSYVGFSLPFCLLCSAFALLPDFDVLFRKHRSISHSFLVYLPILILASVLRLYDEQISNFLIAVWFALSSHVFLDFLVGYSPAFWPISKDEFLISVEVNTKFGRSFLVTPRLEISRRRFDPRSFDKFEIIAVTSEGILISILLILISLPRLLH